MQGQASFDPKSRNSIRYLSLHDNKYIKFFPAHTKSVTALSMSAKSDHFISTGMVRSTNSGNAHLVSKAFSWCDRKGVFVA